MIVLHFLFPVIFAIIVLSSWPTVNGQSVNVLENPCLFDCLNGRCDHVTRTCICLPGWLGAGCEFCALGMACQPAVPRLALILPQAGPMPDKLHNATTMPFVYAHGSGMPKSANGHYTCLFGSAESSLGQWVSSSLVRCPLPSAPQEPAKLAFSIVPTGSNQFLSYHPDWGTSHFTFFTRCQREKCQGHCLGPLCLCPHSRTGAQCEAANLTVNATQQLRLNDSEFGTAVEFQPYMVKLPIEQQDMAQFALHSDIGEKLQLDPFLGLLYWPSPVGRSKPYSVAVQIHRPDGQSQQLNWTLRVKPSYKGELDHRLTLTNGSNGRELTGRVVWTGKDSKPTLNESIPLMLHISSINMALKPVMMEEIPIWTEPDGQHFRHVLLPPLGTDNKISITLRHPGYELEQHLHQMEQHNDEMNPLEWTQERVEVTDFPAEVNAEGLLNAGNETEPMLVLNYTVRIAPMNGDCLAGWRFEVVEPRELFAVNGTVQKANARQIQLQLRPLVPVEQLRPTQNGKDEELPLLLAFICMPTGQSLVVRQILRGLSCPTPSDQFETVAELYPKRIFVDLGQSSAVLPLDIRLPPGHTNQLQRANLESASFAPFNLVWLSRRYANSWRLWLAPRAEERQKSSSLDGALIIQGAENLALSVPFHVQQQQQTFTFTLTLKYPENLQSAQSPEYGDVELFSQGREQFFVRTLLLNTPEQFGPIWSDLFQLRVRSRHFLQFSTLIRLTALDNALIVEMRPQTLQYFTFDGQQFDSEWEGIESISQPNVHFRPAIFTPKNSEQFVDVLYAAGTPESFVTVQPGTKLPGIRLPMGEKHALCLGCGFRQLVRLNVEQHSTDCAALAVAVPFQANQPVGSIPAVLQFQQHFLMVFDQKREHLLAENGTDLKIPQICHANRSDEIPIPPLAIRTQIYRNCALSRLRQCRTLFRSAGTRCQQWWHQLADDLLSIHSLAQFLLLTADCRREQSGTHQMLELVDCIERVDRECPVHPMEAEMAPHLGGQLFNQMGYLRPYRTGLDALFPALGLIEAQLVNFPAQIADFLRQLDAIFPSKLMTPFASAHFYDQFVAAISSDSPNGTLVDWAELDAILADSRDSAYSLVQRWNWLVLLLRGDRSDLLEDGTDANKDLVQFRELVKSADRLKSVTRQFGGQNPFAMFREVLARIFDNVAFHPEVANITAEGDLQEQVVAFADVRVEPMEPVEGEEFRIFANIQTHQLLRTDLHGIRLDLHFVQPSPLKFRVGPVFSGQPLGEAMLRPGERIHVDWTVLPVPELVLTETVEQELDLLFAFELDGQRKAQRLRTPRIRIRPRPSLRLLAFAQPTLPSTDSTFSLLLSAINSGYSTLETVELLELRPQLLPAEISADNNSPMDFRISGIRLETDGNQEKENGHEELGQRLAFGRIPSGRASHMTVNISLLGDGRRANPGLALFRNFSAVVAVNGALLPPGIFEQRFFLVQDAARRDHSLLIVSEHSSPLPLYLFSKRDSSLTPLTTLQLIEEKESRPIFNGQPFLTRVFALRRLAIFPSAPGTLNSTTAGAVLASLSVDTASTFGQGAKLLRVAEIGAQGKQRAVDMGLVWIGQGSNEMNTLVNFVDMGASAAVPQLIYELLFGKPEHFRAPFFPQSTYQLHLMAPVVPMGQQVLARISAVSQQNKALNYSLWSVEQQSPFSIVPSTGDLVLNQPLLYQTDYCLNLAVTDSEGHTARVPLQISVLGTESFSGNSCQLFAENIQQHVHKFKPMAPEEVQKDLLVITLPPATAKVAARVTVTEGQFGVPEGEEVELEEEEQTTPHFTVQQHIQHSFNTQTTQTTQTTTAKSTMSTTTMVFQEVPMLPAFSSTPGQLATAGHQREFSYEIIGPVNISATTVTPNPINPTTSEGWQFSTHSRVTPITRMTAPQRASPRPTVLPSSVQIGAIPIGPIRPGQTSRKNGTALAVQREGKDEIGSQASASAMAEMACRLRGTKPIWALICDMAKTVYRTGMQNAR